MNAQVDQRIRTRVPILAEFSSRTIPQGSVGTIVECFENPEGYAEDEYDLVEGRYKVE